jgi:hypothetical protein
MLQKAEDRTKSHGGVRSEFGHLGNRIGPPDHWNLATVRMIRRESGFIGWACIATPVLTSANAAMLGKDNRNAKNSVAAQ